MKILASDFDNTIYFLDDEEKNIRNSEAIKKFISQGNIFCIITGRNYSDLKLLLNKYKIPYSYFPKDNVDGIPDKKWRSTAFLLFANWLNYFVYQQTPFDLNELNN